MPIEFHCTHCGRMLQAGDASPGTRILCPACGAFSAVPAPQPVPQAGTPPIEFRCPGCNKLLRTAGDTAGKQAKCPECGQIVSVPGPAAKVPPETLPYPPPSPVIPPGSPFAAASGPAAAGDVENPYLAPTQYGPPAALAGADPLAASRVAGPAVALIITGVLGIVAQALVLIVNLVELAGGMRRPGQQAMPVIFSGGLGVGMAGIELLIGIVVVIGAVKMKNLENYGFAMAAAVLAMVPCMSPCCLLGLPFGIWALVVLSDAGVKAAFRN